MVQGLFFARGAKFFSERRTGMNDILMQIRSDLPSFSKGQKRIANYILESYDKAAFMTASRLGKMVEVSESTVVRFAVELGFDGYPSMQKTLQELVRNKLTSVQRIEVTNDRLGNQDVVSTVLQGDIDSIRMTSEALSRSRDGRVRAGNFEGEEHLYRGRSLVCCAGGIFELLPAQHV